MHLWDPMTNQSPIIVNNVPASAPMPRVGAMLMSKTIMMATWKWGASG